MSTIEIKHKSLICPINMSNSETNMLIPPSASPQNTRTLRCSKALELACGGKKIRWTWNVLKETFLDLEGWRLLASLFKLSLSLSIYLYMCIYIFFVLDQGANFECLQDGKPRWEAKMGSQDGKPRWEGLHVNQAGQPLWGHDPTFQTSLPSSLKMGAQERCCLRPHPNRSTSGFLETNPNFN